MKTMIKTITTGRKTQGQAMVLTVLAIGGAIMGATAIAGLLMLYQIRATTDAEHSAQAVFAADTGINWATFTYFCAANPTARCDGKATDTISVGPSPVTYAVTCYAPDGTEQSCSNTTTAQAVSIGISLNSKRAFSLDLHGVTTTP